MTTQAATTKGTALPILLFYGMLVSIAMYFAPHDIDMLFIGFVALMAVLVGLYLIVPPILRVVWILFRLLLPLVVVGFVLGIGVVLAMHIF
ncbi:hypothetical protein [Paraburkholderia graminis]